ncbi:hypothetical protein [Flagellimonas sp. CMM7]|uniref:hypothetical protein n=1 Tax=Flagellimonas sp. CMM7 TaxID=2654676 RepID=UPI0013D35CC6|nr:hypothetical protein [Flagellimonas sp. CMM7]UII80290.1 hypothetical protein LV704_01970 [Flagellimonas sp. CMM7]
MGGILWPPYPDYYRIEFGIDYENAILQNTPKNENEILRKRAGKMLRDIAQQIDETGVFTSLN